MVWLPGDVVGLQPCTMFDSIIITSSSDTSINYVIV